jgi:phosphohistidine phosphatase
VIVHLLRHGDAEEHAAAGGDAARALTADGRKKLDRAVRAWSLVVGHVDCILASPLLRAQQTAKIFRGTLASPPAIETEPALLPEADPHQALALLHARCCDGREGVACVGHEPHLGRLLGLLLTGSDRAIPMRKGMLALVEMDGAASTIGRLVAVLSQKVAGQLSR